MILVEIKKTDLSLGIKSGEVYVGVPYSFDPMEKVTLIGRIPDGYNPQCNQYWTNVFRLGIFKPHGNGIWDSRVKKARERESKN